MADLVVASLGVVANTSTSYCTRAQLKAELGVTDADDDGLMDISIAAASREIDGYCGQRFFQDATVTTREFHADNGRSVIVADDHGGISTTTGLIVAIDTDGTGTWETTLTVDTDYLLRPNNAADLTPVRPYDEIWLADNYSFPRPTNGRPGVRVTAKWGWPAVPDDVTKACLIQSMQLYKAKDAPFGAAGFGEFGVLRVNNALHPIARGLLAPYRRPAVG